MFFGAVEPYLARAVGRRGGGCEMGRLRGRGEGRPQPALGADERGDRGHRQRRTPVGRSGRLEPRRGPLVRRAPNGIHDLDVIGQELEILFQQRAGTRHLRQRVPAKLADEPPRQAFEGPHHGVHGEMLQELPELSPQDRELAIGQEHPEEQRALCQDEHVVPRLAIDDRDDPQEAECRAPENDEEHNASPSPIAAPGGAVGGALDGAFERTDFAPAPVPGPGMIQAGLEALCERLLQGRLGAPLAQQSKALELGESEEIGCQSHE